MTARLARRELHLGEIDWYARGEIEVYELSRNEFTASVRVMMFQKRIRITQKVGTEFITKDAYGGCAFIRTRKGGESTEVLLDSFPECQIFRQKRRPTCEPGGDVRIAPSPFLADSD
ncbi:hypothetical protein M405DRAFT_839590 [Rhizopogon salebrosus TDB-379]|nr:hypothetical protein M405DRAFT_839590 [Rhizopogon salebrosus TDB-379]